MQEHNGCEQNRKWQPSSVKEIKQMFGAIFDGLKSKGYYRYSLTESGVVCKLVICEDDSAVDLPGESHIPLTEQDKEDLICEATSIYLAKWLGQDKNAKQTINSFATRGFCAVDEKERLDHDDGTDHGRRSCYKRAEQKFRDMIALYPEQAIAEGSGYKPETFWKVSERKLHAVDEMGPGDSPNGGIWYDFQDICLIKWIAEDKFSFYDLLVYSKRFMSKSNTPRNEAIRQVFSEYFAAIENLKSCSDDREYTISAIMIQQIEATFGHMAAAYLARASSSYPELQFEDIMRNSAAWWARSRYYPFFEKAGNLPVDMPYHILRYGEMASILDSTDSQYLSAVRKQLLKRGLVTEMLLFANVLSFPRILPSWSKENYRDAAEFYRKEYPIVERHTPEDVGNIEEWTDRECDFIRYFYESISSYGLDHLRAENQKIRKERNARYNHRKQPT